VAPGRHLLVQRREGRGRVRYLPEGGREGHRRRHQGPDLIGGHVAGAIQGVHQLVVSGERVGLVPAGALDVDVALEAHDHVGEQVAEDRHRGEGLAHRRRDLPRPQSDPIADRRLDLVAPLAPSPLGQLEQQLLLARVVTPHARSVQARPLGDPRQGDEPNAAELDGKRLGRREQVLGPLRLVLDRSGSLVHTASLTHPEMRYLGVDARVANNASLGALSASPHRGG
jgi:hypothetical protein